MNTEAMTNFFRNAKRLGLCDEYTLRWQSANMSKKRLFDLACNVQSLGYIARSIMEGWGLTPEYISEEFKSFINGEYAFKDGYTSTIYCLYDEPINVDTTAMLIVGCNTDIIIPKTRVSELHIVNSKVRILDKGKAFVYLYNSEITNTDHRAIIKERYNNG